MAYNLPSLCDKPIALVAWSGKLHSSWLPLWYGPQTHKGPELLTDHAMQSANYVQSIKALALATQIWSLSLTANAQGPCVCTNVDAESQAQGTCSKVQLEKSCSMTWNAGAQGRLASAADNIIGELEAAFAKNGLGNFSVPPLTKDGDATVHPLEIAVTNLNFVDPKEYDPRILSSFLLLAGAALNLANVHGWAEAFGILAYKDSENLLAGLRGSTVRQGDIGLLAYTASTGCLKIALRVPRETNVVVRSPYGNETCQ
jgi:hypothetical protein